MMLCTHLLTKIITLAIHIRFRFGTAGDNHPCKLRQFALARCAQEECSECAGRQQREGSGQGSCCPEVDGAQALHMSGTDITAWMR